MPTIPVPNCIMAELIFVQNSVRMQNVLHFTVPGVPTIAQLTALRNVIVAWDRTTPVVAGQLHLNRGSQNSFVGVKCTSLHNVNDIVDEYVLPISSVGNGGTNHPTFTSLAVKLGSGLSGRAHRGRIYHCGLTYTFGIDGFITAANADLLKACYENLKAQALTAGFTLVVASKYLGVEIVNGHRRGIPRAQGITTPVTTIGVERGPDTNRHRKLPHLL